jgi:molybdopterin synthase catalytic subunit
LRHSIVELTHHPIDRDLLFAAVQSDAAGAVACFVGTVRDHHAGRGVRSLAYEAYEPMALREMRSIADEAARRWPLHGVALVHRLGAVPVGDASVVVTVSSAHRAAAFDACRFAIERIKAGVPIWKREEFADGTSAWVGEEPAATPAPPAVATIAR